MLTATRQPPFAPLLHQREHFRVPTGLPGPEGAAVGRARLIASGSPGGDYASISKGLETFGNQKLASAGWAFHLLPDCRSLRRLWPGPGHCDGQGCIQVQSGSRGRMPRGWLRAGILLCEASQVQLLKPR